MDWLIGELVMLAAPAYFFLQVLMAVRYRGRWLVLSLVPLLFMVPLAVHAGFAFAARFGPVARAADLGVTHSVCLPFGPGHSKGERCLGAAFLGEIQAAYIEQFQRHRCNWAATAQFPCAPYCNPA